MAEASQEPLQLKTLFLKVSIHCEGCKKKVKRVLKRIQGVSEVDIDSFQQKVTVIVTGNIDHGTLITKLNKSHKQASVWPEAKKPSGNQNPNTSSDTKNQNKESNSKPKDEEPKESSGKPKEKQPEPAKEKSSDKGDEKVKEKEKPKTEDEMKSKPQEKDKEKDKDAVKEKPKEKEKEKAKEQPEPETKPNSGGGGENKKEKEKKNESSGKEGGQQMERGISPPHPKQDFMNPYSYPYPPQPIMSYHMAQPTSSQAYYQQPPMPGTQGYMYPQPNPYPYQTHYPYGAPPEYIYGSTESSTRRDNTALDYFNEEDANSCSVM